MNASFSWVPDVTVKPAGGISFDMACTLSRALFDDNRPSEFLSEFVMDRDVLPVLHGIRAATDDADLAEEADELAEVIREHNAIRIVVIC